MFSPQWETAKRVLCIRIDSMGDVMMTTPAIRALRRASPERRITLLTSPEGGELAEMLPDVDEIILYRPPWMKAAAVAQDAADDRAMIDRLRAENFDAAAIFTVYSQNPLPVALLCHLAGIPLRLAHCRENPYRLLTEWVPEKEPQKQIRHEVQRQLDLVAAVGCRVDDDRLRLHIPERAALKIRHLLDGSGIELDRPWMLVHAGAYAASRRYPPEMYAEAAAVLGGKLDFQLVFTGVEAERELIEEIRSRLAFRTVSLVGRLALAEFAALIDAAPLLLSNNTGPVHLAAALGTPTVVLYALTNLQRTPWKTPQRVLFHDVPCNNCLKSVCPLEHHRCLRGVPPRDVVAAVLELFEETAVKTRRNRNSSTQSPSDFAPQRNGEENDSFAEWQSV